MLDLLYRKKTCREFLKVYTEDLYRDIIPNVFEIGVLTLQNNFNKILFRKEELEEIILDLKNEENTQNTNFKHLQKLTGKKTNENIREIENKRNEEIKFKKKESIEVYPNWWWNIKDDQEENSQMNKFNQFKKIQSEEIKSQIHENFTNQKMIKDNKNDYDFFDNNYNNQIKNNDNIFNNFVFEERNLDNNEKPRKKMIMNKLTKGNSNLFSSERNNYHEKIQQKKRIFNTNNINEEIIEQQNSQIPKNKTNYKIIFDKDLKPEKIEKIGIKNYHPENKGNIDERFNINSNEQKRYYQMSPNQFYGSKNNYNEDEF